MLVARYRGIWPSRGDASISCNTGPKKGGLLTTKRAILDPKQTLLTPTGWEFSRNEVCGEVVVKRNDSVDDQPLYHIQPGIFVGMKIYRRKSVHYPPGSSNLAEPSRTPLLVVVIPIFTPFRAAHTFSRRSYFWASGWDNFCGSETS